MTLTGNVFTLLMFVSIRRYERTSRIHSYNGWESFIRKTTRHRIAIIGLLILSLHADIINCVTIYI